VERVKRRAVFFAVILIGRPMAGQDKKPWSVDRLCGRLEHVERIPDRKHVDNFPEAREALRDVPVVIYERHENEPCCENSTPIDATRTGKGGRFELKDEKPGSYWLGTNWNGKEYKVAVDYKAGKSSETMCSQQGVQVDHAGNADWWITVTVD
jgi:hypothetical protein